MNMDLFEELKVLKFSILRADGLYKTYFYIDSIIPITPYDYRETHRVHFIYNHYRICGRDHHHSLT